MRAGQRIGGRYELRGELGRGGMGHVYLAEDLRLGRAVAVKLIAPHLQRDRAQGGAALARFAAEARIAATLSHPCIVTVHDFIDDPASPALVMEYVEGETLAARLARGERWSVEGAAALLARVCDGLTVAHAAGLVHRDLKPANLMLTMTGGLKILDFGIAHGGPAGAWAAATVQGSIEYMAPEQIRGGVVDQRADLWSLGVVGFELVSGSRPFDGMHGTAVGQQVLNEEPAWYRFPWPGSAFEAVLRRALAKAPAHRWRSASVMATALRHVAQAPGAATAVPDSTPGWSLPMDRGRLALVAAATGLLVMAMLLILLLLDQNGRPGTGPGGGPPFPPDSTTIIAEGCDPEQVDALFRVALRIRAPDWPSAVQNAQASLPAACLPEVEQLLGNAMLLRALVLPLLERGNYPQASAAVASFRGVLPAGFQDTLRTFVMGQCRLEQQAGVAIRCPGDASATHAVWMRLDGGTYRFAPDRLLIASGDIVSFINQSGGPHNVQFWADSIPTGAAGSLDAAMPDVMAPLAGPLLVEPNASYDIVFANAPVGTYRLFCLPHLANRMTARIDVQ